jgi:hypothetical protein
MIMADRFTSALLAALNEAAEVKEGDWNSIEAVLRAPVGRQASGALPAQGSGSLPENRFAATISSGMARIRSGR